MATLKGYKPSVGFIVVEEQWPFYSDTPSGIYISLIVTSEVISRAD